MSEQEKKGEAPKKTLSKKNAIGVMVGGAALFALSLVLPAQPGTALYFARLGLGTIGIIVVCVGAYLRPLTPEKAK